MGINPQSLSYGFINEIMDRPCSDVGLGSDRIGCTKFNEGVDLHFSRASSLDRQDLLFIGEKLILEKKSKSPLILLLF